jgi:hypothetical protein
MKSFVIISFYSIGVYVANYLLIDVEDLVLRQFSAQEGMDIPESVVMETIDHLKYWNKFSVIITFLFFSLKGLIISFILYIGLFFEDLEKGFHLIEFFKIAVYAEGILVIAGLIKTLVISSGGYSYDFLIQYYPLSLLNLFDYSEINHLFLYPLQVANVFELAYIFLLVYFLKEEIEIPFFQSFKIVIYSYGAAMLCWIVFIMFCTLNFS